MGDNANATQHVANGDLHISVGGLARVKVRDSGENTLYDRSTVIISGEVDDLPNGRIACSSRLGMCVCKNGSGRHTFRGHGDKKFVVIVEPF